MSIYEGRTSVHTCEEAKALYGANIFSPKGETFIPFNRAKVVWQASGAPILHSLHPGGDGNFFPWGNILNAYIYNITLYIII